LSLAVLVTAGLCLRSLRGLQAIDAGFDPQRVLAMWLDVSRSGYDEARGRIFYSSLIERVAALPGVESAAFAEILPLTGGGMRITSQPEGHVSTEDKPINLSFNVVTPGWFRTMGAAVLRGRDFTPADTADSPKVAIVNEALVARYWPGQNGLGKHIELSAMPGGKPAQLEVVGVVGNTKYRSLTEPVPPTMFLPLAQNYASTVVLFVRGAAPGALAAPVRQTVQALDAHVPVFNIRTLAEQKQASLYTWRMAATLLSALGGLGLALAALGVYGVMAFAVEQRTREIGIRMALGAQRFDVLRLVVGQGARFVLMGLALGLGGALAMGSLVRTLLYGVEPTDALTFAGVALLLCVVALLACYLPARRATQVDPMVALRYE
jgi:predicted permease